MKKVIFALLALCAIVFTSCSTEDTASPEQAIQKTDVTMIVASPAQTAKQVYKDGSIPASVSGINVLTTYNGTPSYAPFTTPFELVTNASADKNFTISNVAIGSNTFTATTTTDAAKKYVLAPSSGTASAKITELKANNPYVIYSGTKTQNIFATNNVINIDMTTQHGRILSVFQLEDNSAFKNGYEATITAKVDGENSAGTTKVQKSGIVYFEWSNEKALAGKKVVYTIDVTPINNNNNLHTIYTIEQTIKASTNISCVYTISKDNAPSPYTNENKLTFSFQKWNEEQCETCKSQK